MSSPKKPIIGARRIVFYKRQRLHTDSV